MHGGWWQAGYLGEGAFDERGCLLCTTIERERKGIYQQNYMKIASKFVFNLLWLYEEFLRTVYQYSHLILNNTFADTVSPSIRSIIFQLKVVPQHYSDLYLFSYKMLQYYAWYIAHICAILIWYNTLNNACNIGWIRLDWGWNLNAQNHKGLRWLALYEEVMRWHILELEHIGNWGGLKFTKCTHVWSEVFKINRSKDLLSWGGNPKQELRGFASKFYS